MKPLVFALFLTLTLSLCGSPDSGDEVTEEGSDITNPFGALSALKNIAEEAEDWQAELENMEPVDPLHFNELLPTLPDPPAGWAADDPEGSTTRGMGGFEMSQASRTYRMGDKRVKIEIADWAYNKVVYMPFMLAASMSQETTEGYNKGIKVGEDPGRDEYTYKSKRGKRIILVGKRFPVTLDTNGLEPDEIDGWWKLIGTDELRAKAN